jgi:hypothetical protein
VLIIAVIVLVCVLDWWLRKRRGRTVSRNNQTGPAWEQDAPWPEIFEEDF